MYHFSATQCQTTLQGIMLFFQHRTESQRESQHISETSFSRAQADLLCHITEKSGSLRANWLKLVLGKFAGYVLSLVSTCSFAPLQT